MSTEDERLGGGSLLKIIVGDTLIRPMLQILKIRPIYEDDGATTLKVMVSDGEIQYDHVLLHKNLTTYIHKDALLNFSIIRVDDWVRILEDDCVIIVIASMDVVFKCSDVIGKPVPFDQSCGTSCLEMYRRNLFYSIKRDYEDVSLIQKNKNQKMFGFDAPKLISVPFQEGILRLKMIKIDDLTQVNCNDCILARVVGKSDIREWSNDNSKGKVFNIALCDGSGTIKMTGFNSAVDKFFSFIKVNGVYVFQNFTVARANTKYDSTGHQFRLTFRDDTLVLQSSKLEASMVPPIAFDFILISAIPALPAGAVIGVVVSQSNVTSFTCRTTGRQSIKCIVQIVDKSNCQIGVTVWGTASKQVWKIKSVVAMKGVKVSNFGGKSLSFVFDSTVIMDPNHARATELTAWYSCISSHPPPNLVSTFTTDPI